MLFENTKAVRGAVRIHKKAKTMLWDALKGAAAAASKLYFVLLVLLGLGFLVAFVAGSRQALWLLTEGPSVSTDKILMITGGVVAGLFVGLFISYYLSEIHNQNKQNLSY